MQLRACHLACLSDCRNLLPHINDIAFGNQNLSKMGVGCDHTAFMLHQDQRAEGFDIAPDERNGATRRGARGSQ